MFFSWFVRFSWLFVSQLVVLSWSLFIRYIESIFPLKFIIVYAPKHICCVDFLFLVFLTFVCLLLTLVHFLFLFMPLCCKTSENLKIIQSKFNYISCEFDYLYSIRKRLKCNFRILFVCFDGFPHLFSSFVVVAAAAVVFATFLFASFVLLCDGCNLLYSFVAAVYSHLPVYRKSNFLFCELPTVCFWFDCIGRCWGWCEYCRRGQIIRDKQID